jgi:DNA-binding LacI/PurR family transcriptional regulator
MGAGEPLSVRPTLEAVARHAGVSRATVSRVVNGAVTVAPRLREAVQRSVEALGYVPNQAARSLVTHRTDTLALVVTEPQQRVFSDDPYFATLIDGVGQELDAADKQLVLLMSASGVSHDRVYQYAAAGHVDGLMMFSLHGADPLPTALLGLGLPVVCNGRPLGSPDVPYVDTANREGAADAVRYLLAQGRRRIATITGSQDMAAGLDRLDGYRDAIREAGAPARVASGRFTRESGVLAMCQLLAEHPDLDAVFAGSDLMADGALRTLRQAGRRVPDDVAVVGFDDNTVAAFAEPPLTTVRQPIRAVGRMLANMVLRLADGYDVEPRVILPTELIIRRSA